YC
ncbi:phage regulatory protein Rha, partial [Haemophilus influenzae]